MALAWRDHRADVAAWAQQKGVSQDACALLLDADFVDLHCDLEVPVRLYGYDPTRRHAPRSRPPIFFGQTDYPRLLEAGFTGIVADIATNIFRPQRGRQAITLANLDRMEARIRAHDELALVRTRAEYDVARAAGRMAMFVALQGGNALAEDPSVLDGEVGQRLHRITLVHLTSSVLGGSNSPSARDDGLTAAGRDFVSRCNANRVLVDLAHAGKKTFWDMLDAHDRTLPPIVSHVGVDGVYPLWRNLDDDQVRAIAERGGVIGIIYQSSFLENTWIRGRRARILDHVEHVCRLVGDDFAAIGTDYDGMIVPPRDLPDVTDHPLLVQDMLDRGWSETRIRKVLGLNYLDVIARIRP